MGYCISQDEAIFSVEKKHFSDMLLAIQRIKSGAWTNGTLNCITVEDALKEWRWYPEFDGRGNISYIQFQGEKSGDEDKLFDAIAPYVDSGSFIQMHGEDGCIWRWVFDGKTYDNVGANIDFEAIVDAILKHKKLIPLLMGIHPELDKRIVNKVKKGKS